MERIKAQRTTKRPTEDKAGEVRPFGRADLSVSMRRGVAALVSCMAPPPDTRKWHKIDKIGAVVIWAVVLVFYALIAFLIWQSVGN